MCGGRGSGTLVCRLNGQGGEGKGEEFRFYFVGCWSEQAGK